MSRFIVTAPVLALAATAAPAYASPTYNWTGFYVGAHGGYVDTTSHWDGDNIFQTVVDGGEGSLTIVPHTDIIAEKHSNGEIGGGGTVGFNFQAGSVVLGAEADATFFSFDRHTMHTAGAGSYTLHSHASNLETVRARAGVAFGPAMIFATGGVAFTNLKHAIAATDMSQVIVDGGEGGSTIGAATANLSDRSSTNSGWTVGGGAEVKLGSNLSLALTLLHVDLGKEHLADASPPSSIAATVKSKMFVGMLGLNLSF